MLAEIEHFYTDDFGQFELDKEQEEVLMNYDIEHPLIRYYLARAHWFLRNLGIPEEAIRFRQHGANEKAHYACD